MNLFKRKQKDTETNRKPDDCYLCYHLSKPTCPDLKTDLSPHYGCLFYLTEAEAYSILGKQHNDDYQELPNRVKCTYCGSYNVHITYGNRFECDDCKAIFR
jgi:Zn finger protein HypA/HybF involved in hydrogenase expression